MSGRFSSTFTGCFVLKGSDIPLLHLNHMWSQELEVLSNPVIMFCSPGGWLTRHCFTEPGELCPD